MATVISDKERREVARRLRGLNGNAMHVRRVYEAEGFSISCDDQADYYQTCDAITGYLPAEHMHPVDYEELHNRLADLIEPTCDRDALLALSDEMTRKTGNWDVSVDDIPYVIAGYLPAYAERIRRALGVEDG